MLSLLRWTQGLAYGQVQKRYKGSSVDRIDLSPLYGNARLKHVLSLFGYKQMNTSVVERHDGTCRQCNRCEGLKTLGFSKAKR